MDITKKKKPFTDNETSSLINDYIQFPFMIIDNFPNFIQRVIKNSEDDFYNIVQGCRHCGYAGNLHRHACYHRTIICKQITARVRIQRVICPIEMYIESRSSLHIIIGKNMLGNYACIPNFEIGCYLSDFSDIFWNTEKLCSLIGEADGVTAATAIKYINEELSLWDYF